MSAARLLLRLLASLALSLAAALLPPAAARAAPAWVWPLPGPHVVSRPFAPGPTPYSPGHRGVDLPAAVGTTVSAAGAGRVSYAGLLAGRGVVVVVHGALRTTYEPVAALVSTGAAVGAGQALGTLEAGHAGCPVAACLHWGLLRGDVYLDPVSLVDPVPVRLLPRDIVPGPAAVGPRAAAVPAAAPAALPVEAAPAATSAPPPGHRSAVRGTLAATGLVGLGIYRRRRRSTDP